MLRNKIQNKTGLARKAIEYYEEKTDIKQCKFRDKTSRYSGYIWSKW